MSYLLQTDSSCIYKTSTGFSGRQQSQARVKLSQSLLSLDPVKITIASDDCSRLPIYRPEEIQDSSARSQHGCRQDTKLEGFGLWFVRPILSLLRDT